MKTTKKANYLLLFLSFSIISNSLYAHKHDYEKTAVKEWHIEGKTIKGSFLMSRNDSVFIENAKQTIVSFPISKFSEADKKFIGEKNSKIQFLNQTLSPSRSFWHRQSEPTIYPIMVVAALLFSLTLLFFSPKRKLAMPVLIAASSTLLFGFTDPNIIRNAFLPFAPYVNTFWDNTYFYVESSGIPASHTMMVGISNHGWQQQVPIPQCYVGTNAWSIPLNPVMATSPIPVDQIHFTRGAIAVAVNGVPIFNPHTNTGVDAYTDGQLDNYGGHSGRGDDYHYHTAPLHLYNQTTATLPIAYAFDGFAVYGSLEPDSTTMTTLDDNHGHWYNGEYHYHGTSSYPYMIAAMAGQVTEDATHQLIPQAAAHPVRTENWTPLNGALITSCVPNAANNGYNLSYTLNGVSGYAVNYAWTGNTYTFNYITPTGTTSTNYNGNDISPTPTPTIIGNTTICINNIENYAVFNPVIGGVYNWNVSNGTILSGQGTAAITVQWNSGSVGHVFVTQTSP